MHQSWLPVEVKPDPVMVSTVPTGPDVGESVEMTGACVWMPEEVTVTVAAVEQDTRVPGQAYPLKVAVYVPADW